jgi:hypothetical protein
MHDAITHIPYVAGMVTDTGSTSTAEQREQDDKTAWVDRMGGRRLSCDIVDYPHTHSHGYSVVGISNGSKVWTDGDVEFKHG